MAQIELSKASAVMQCANELEDWIDKYHDAPEKNGETNRHKQL
jgi:hypothetical protein